MGLTMTQKILAQKAGLESVKPGQFVEVNLDLVMSNDITAPVALDRLTDNKLDKVFDKDKIVFVLDHFVPNKDIKSAENCKKIRAFSQKHSIEKLYDVGRMGIEHALLPEQGLVIPGDAVIGADSHTCTYGALGAFSTGVGSTDCAYAMYTGKTWLKVPSAIKVIIKGELPEFVSGKDVILYIINKLGVDGALYRSLEFCGNISALSMDDRFTISNMAIECGAKNGIFPVDEKTVEYMKGRSDREYKIFTADEDAEYESELTVNLSELRPVVACPHLPSNMKYVDELEDVKIDQAVIGSCTNGRIEDMRAAAAVLKGRKVNPNVRTIIIPATQQIYLQCIKEGLAEIFINAGAAFSTPTCGPCLGGHMGILAKGEVAISTTNRNFVGRMGHPESKIYLSNPYIAAASSVAGKIISVKGLDNNA